LIIQSDKEATRRTLALSNGTRVQEESLRRADSAKLAVMYKKQQVLREVKEQVSVLSLNRVIATLKDDLTLDKHLAIIDSGIARIGGQ
jgi:F0F1-type ATP synthase membrane subunit b/b'